MTYTFPGTEYTTEKFKWVWYDGPGAPKNHKDLKLPNNEELPNQGAMFIGEKGKLLLPHFMELPRLIVNRKYEDLDLSIIKEADQPGAQAHHSGLIAVFDGGSPHEDAYLLGRFGRFNGGGLRWRWQRRDGALRDRPGLSGLSGLCGGRLRVAGR